MRPAVVVLCGVGVAGTAYVALRSAPHPVALATYGQPITFFQEDRQALLVGNTPHAVSSLSAEACGSCHKKEYAAWKTSGHAHSVTEPVFAAAFKAEQRFVCRSCHSPLVEQHPLLVHSLKQSPRLLFTGEEAQPLPPGHPAIGPQVRQALGGGPRPNIVEKNPRYDAALAAEGVTCAACHVRDSVVLTANPKASSNVPHPLLYAPVMAKAEFCAGCHQFDIDSPRMHPFEHSPSQRTGSAAIRLAMMQARRARIASIQSPNSDENSQQEQDEPPVPPEPGIDQQYQQEARVQHTLDEFRISPAALRGETCQSCHMPADGKVHLHSWPGRDTLAMLQKAISLTARLDKASYAEGDKLQAVIRLKNDAGHRFPTGDSIHAGILDVWLRDGTKTLGRQVFVMRSERQANVIFFADANFRHARRMRDDAALEAPTRADTRLLPAEEATLVFSQRVTRGVADAQDLNLRVRVFHSAVHPGFKGSRVDPKVDTLRLIREEVLPVKIRARQVARGVGPGPG